MNDNRYKVVNAKASNHGMSNLSFQQIESLLHNYKENYIRNLDYLLKYTGMKKRMYKRRITALGVKNGISIYDAIKRQSTLGFDIIAVASLSNMFKLPMSLLLNYSLEDVEGFCPEDYGIYRNMYKTVSIKPNQKDNIIVPKSANSAYKTLFHKKRLQDPNSPTGLVNIWLFVK